MSTKTLRKRIALVAVAALGAGVLSVAPANAAPNEAPATASPSAALLTLNIGTTANLLGAAVLSSDTAASSVGLVATSDIAGTRVAGTTQTAVLLSSGTLAVYTLLSATTTNTANIGVITVENGTIAGSVGGQGVNSGSTAVVGNGASATHLAASIRPSSGASSMTVRMYNAAQATYSSTSAAVANATALAAPTLGTLTGQITVTIASASESGVMVPSKSRIFYSDATVDSTDDGQTADADAATLNNGGLGCLNIQLNDGYGQDITSQTGLLTATATNNAVLAFAAADCAAGTVAGSAFQAGSTATPADVVLSVAAPSSAPLSTTVTISYNGVVVGTKTFVIKGKISKMTVSDPGIGALNAGSDDNAIIKFQDAAGNVIYPSSSSTAYPWSSSVLSITSSTASSVVTGATVSATAPNGTNATDGYIEWTCGAVAGSANITLTYVNPDGSSVVSNAFKATCAGNAYSYSAAWDKTSYTPGSVATLLVTVKDSNGNLANDYGTLGAATTYVGAPATALDTPASGDKPYLGVKKYKFIVGTTEGSFEAVVNNSALNTLSGATANTVIAGYKIASATTGVTNADVLKAIVSLIASINKQIAALQKALLRR